MRGQGVDVRLGPFVLRLQTTLPDVARHFGFLYGDFPVDEGGVADFHVRLVRPRGVRRVVYPQVLFYCDGRSPYAPFPRRLGLALLEWGLNWCVMSHANLYLNIHSAVVERGGRAVIMPAAPGSGKSTLCAALVHRGWRLLSDEMALVRPDDGRLVPIPRPISLKDASIGLIRAFAPEARFGPELPETSKGTLSHLRPPSESVARAGETASPAWVIFPTYTPGVDPELKPIPKTRFLLHVASNSFNYGVLGARGFETLARLIETCACFQFRYSRLDDALKVFDSLPSPDGAAA